MLLYDEHTWGKDYPAGEIQDWAWNEKSHYAYKAAGLAQSVLADSLSKIASSIRLEQKQRHLVVFNPLAFDRTDVVRVTRFPPEKPFDLIDEGTGLKVPYQIVELDGPLAPAPYAAYRWARGAFEKHELFDLVFVAEKVPSLGYKTYRLAPRAEAPSAASDLRVSAEGLENRFYKVALDPRTGGVAGVYDKELSRELVDRQAPDKLNQFVAKWVQTAKQEGPTAAEIRIGQKGPVYASLIARSSGPGCPEIVQEVVLYADLKRIDLHWANVSNQEVGITLSPVESHLLEFGGLWPCYVSQAHHGVTPADFGRDFVKPEQITKGHMYAFVLDSNFRTNFQPVQQADILFRYSLMSEAGPQANSKHRDFGWSVHNPLTAVLTNGGRQGPLPSQASFCGLDQSNLLLTTIKRAEDGQGLIVRLIETDGKSTAATLTMPAVTLEKAWLTNPVEENQSVLSCTEHSVTVPAKAFGITTVRLQVAPQE
jgi:hypothetical protein